MKGLSKYGAIATKVRAMRGRLFSEDEYVRLANCASVKEVLVFLKAHPGYAKTVKDLDPEHLRREVLERVLIGAIFSDMAKVMNFMDKEQKELLSTYRNYYEIRRISDVLRKIYNRYTEEPDILAYREIYAKSKNFDFDKVIAARSVDELIAALEGSPYQAPIIKVKETIASPKLFDYENGLMRYYFTWYWKQLDRLTSKFDRDSVMVFHGYEIDMLNILWVYRTKAYYDVPQRDIWSYLIPVNYKLKKADLARMVASDNEDECMRIVKGTYYGRLFDREGEGDSPEVVQQQLLKDTARKKRKAEPYSFAAIEAYIYDRRKEIDNLISIIECVRYGYNPKLILDALRVSHH